MKKGSVLPGRKKNIRNYDNSISDNNSSNNNNNNDMGKNNTKKSNDNDKALAFNV